MAKKDETITPYTKKCTPQIYEKVLNIKSDAKKTTTLDQAWVILSEAYGLEGELASTPNSSKFILYKDNKIVNEFKWDTSNWLDGDFDWNFIYKEVLEYCVIKKIFKKKRK